MKFYQLLYCSYTQECYVAYLHFKQHKLIHISRLNSWVKSGSWCIWKRFNAVLLHFINSFFMNQLFTRFALTSLWGIFLIWWSFLWFQLDFLLGFSRNDVRYVIHKFPVIFIEFQLRRIHKLTQTNPDKKHLYSLQI
jgi:hypothetical protein